MLGQKLRSIAGMGLLGLAVLCVPSLVQAADIKDDAKFFSAAAVEKANESIRAIEKKTGHDIRIETYATVPADKVDAVAKMDRAQKETYFREWVTDRAKANEEKGALILICKDPGHVESWYSKQLGKEGLKAEDRGQISKTLLTGLRDKKYDEALTATVEKIGQVFSSLKPAASKPATATEHKANRPTIPVQRHAPVIQRNAGWMPVLMIVGLVIAGIFVISLISRLFGGGGGRGYGPGGGYGQPGYGYGGGGGGFFGNMMGGLFGAMAGNWLYDSFSGGHSAHAHDSYNNQSGGDNSLGDNGSSSQDDQWSNEGSTTDGGWFDGGDSGGGGDFGGGGDGGGDFGGGGDF